jgi:hypothetical protein
LDLKDLGRNLSHKRIYIFPPVIPFNFWRILETNEGDKIRVNMALPKEKFRITNVYGNIMVILE